MIVAMTVLFWLSAAAIAHAWFGYLGFLAVLASFRKAAVRRSPSHLAVSFIVPVHNGADAILRKLANLRALDYPPELVEIIFVDDCSIDGTASLMSTVPGVRVIRLAERRGKAAALNAGLDVAGGDVVAFTDIGGLLASDALALAMERFADSRVGCVSSDDEVASDDGVARGEGVYTRIDTLARRLEGRIRSATGMNGSFYLVRRELCSPFPLDVATDMFSALHCVDLGYRAVVEERSKVRLSAQHDVQREFERKVRTMVTGLRALRRNAPLLNPFRSGLFAMFLWGHKVLRYMSPLFVTTMFASGGFLGGSSLFYCSIVRTIAVVMSIGLCAIVLHGSTPLSRTGPIGRILGLSAFACISLAAAMVGWYRFASGERYETWKPTERSAV